MEIKPSAKWSLLHHGKEKVLCARKHFHRYPEVNEYSRPSEKHGLDV
jgi:hypothetical protein